MRTRLVVLVATVAGALGMAAQSANEWTAQLESLDPARPLAYFELAEVIIDSAPDDRAAVALARHLFGTAGRLDLEGLGASSARALSELVRHPEDGMRLRAAALMLDPLREAAPVTPSPTTIDAETAYDISVAFGGLRTGRGNRLRAVLADAARRALLAEYDSQLGGLDWLDSVSARVRSTPDFAPQEVLQMLRVEVRFLEGATPSWSSEVLTGGGGRLLEVERSEIPRLLEGDPTRPFFRDGQWRANR